MCYQKQRIKFDRKMIKNNFNRDFTLTLGLTAKLKFTVILSFLKESLNIPWTWFYNRFGPFIIYSMNVPNQLPFLNVFRLSFLERERDFADCITLLSVQRSWPFMNDSWPFRSFSGHKKITNSRKRKNAHGTFM